MLIRLILISSFIAMAIGCGRKVDEEKTYSRESEGTPFSYKHSQKQCRSNEISEKPFVDLFRTGAYKSFQLKTVKNRRIIRKLTMGGKYNYRVSRRRGTLQNTVRTKQFNYCFAQSEYESDTYEDAVISVLGPLNEFEQKYSSLIKYYNIKKINLEILPLYKKIQTSRERGKKIETNSYMINNAMYSASTNSLIILPQGTNKYNYVPFGGVPLWKSSGVVMHEYGHHFFKSVFSGKLNLKMTNVNPLDTGLCVDNSNVHFKHVQKPVKTRESVTKNDVLSALNEGFSDVFSFYAGDEKESYRKMGCMFKTRDVKSSTFYSRNKKILDKATIENFLSTEANPALSCYVNTDYQDIHVIGAIYAHAFYELLDGTNLSKSSKIKVLLKWVKQLNSIYIKKMRLKTFMNEAAEKFYNVLKQTSFVRTENCLKYFGKFPTSKYSCN